MKVVGKHVALCATDTPLVAAASAARAAGHRCCNCRPKRTVAQNILLHWVPGRWIPGGWVPGGWVPGRWVPGRRQEAKASLQLEVVGQDSLQQAQQAGDVTAVTAAAPLESLHITSSSSQAGFLPSATMH